VDTVGQAWTDVWSQFGQCLVIFEMVKLAVGLVG
jgi:hypothetical protein